MTTGPSIGYNQLYQLAVDDGGDDALTTAIGIYLHAKKYEALPPEKLREWADQMVKLVLTEVEVVKIPV